MKYLLLLLLLSGCAPVGGGIKQPRHVVATLVRYEWVIRDERWKTEAIWIDDDGQQWADLFPELMDTVGTRRVVLKQK